MRQLSPSDALFLYLDNDSVSAHGTFVWIYDASACANGGVTRSALMEHLKKFLPHFPELTQKLHRLPLEFDYPYWVEDDSFELLYHVREQTLPAQCNWRGFCEAVANIHEQSLDFKHPLWEMTLLNAPGGVQGLPEHCFAITLKFHHAAIDGATGINIISAIHDGGSEPARAAETESTEARKPELYESLFRAGIRTMSSMDKLGGMLRSRFSDDDDEQQQNAESSHSDDGDSSDIPQTLFNQSVSSEHVWESRVFDLDAIKAMRKAVHGATVNDVLLTLCGGALRHYLLKHNALPELAMKAGCPINIRTEGEAQSGGNMIYAMIVSMHTSIEDPMERLRAIKGSSTIAKQQIAEQDPRKMVSIVSLLPAQTQAAIGRLFDIALPRLGRAFKFNGSVSNLPGPQQELSLLGGRLLTINAAMPVMNGFGLFIGLCTYNGKLSVCLSSAANIVKDPGFLGDCVETSFAELQAAIQTTTRRANQSKKGKANPKTKRNAH
ncbi:MAG: wax ester/triacylglycerol synthase family O-acyltransferase [Pseudomonadales bacterium]